MATGRPDLRWPAKLRASTAFCLVGALAGLGLYFGNNYYSNQGTPAAASVTATGVGGHLLVQLANFPLGTTYYFCHAGSGYPTGGVIAGHGSVDVTSPDQSLGALCSGSGNFWIGLQATDGNDYFSNQVTLG